MATPRRKGRPKGPDRGVDEIRVTVRLPRRLVKTLRLYCVEHDLELGKPIAAGLQTVLSGCYFARRDAPRPPSPADPTALVVVSPPADGESAVA